MVRAITVRVIILITAIDVAPSDVHVTPPRGREWRIRHNGSTRVPKALG
jgi:hypothetical protein